MEIIEYCKELLLKPYLDQIESDDECPPVENGTETEKPNDNNEAEKKVNEKSDEINYRLIIDDIDIKIKDKYKGVTMSSPDYVEKRGCQFECAELIGKVIVQQVKALYKEGIYLIVYLDEISELYEDLNYLCLKFEINRSEMDKLSAIKKQEEINAMERLKTIVPAHWTYDPVA